MICSNLVFSLERIQHNVSVIESESKLKSLPIDSWCRGTVFSSIQTTFSRLIHEDTSKQLVQRALALDVDDPRRCAALNCDKFSASIFSALPSQDIVPSSIVFREAAANYLGAPSPICRHTVGFPIRSSSSNHSHKSVDVHGHNLTTATCVPGCGRTPLHNIIQKELVFEVRRCGLSVDVTPGDVIFASLSNEQIESLISDPQSNRIQTTVFPDICIHWDNPDKPPTYYDIKTLGHTQDYHCAAPPPPTRPQNHTINNRERRVRRDYENKTNALDSRLVDHPLVPGQFGPLRARRLAAIGGVNGLAFGAYAEASQGIMELIDEIANQQEFLWNRFGCNCPFEAKGILKRMIRNRLGLKVAFGWAELKFRVHSKAVKSHPSDVLIERAES